jgi:hypothetical protein
LIAHVTHKADICDLCHHETLALGKEQAKVREKFQPKQSPASFKSRNNLSSVSSLKPERSKNLLDLGDSPIYR